MAVQVTSITYRQQSKQLVVGFDSGQTFELSAEYLRVFSPSAEVRGHGLAEPKLVLNKQDVAISTIEPVGQYAVKLRFDDGHDTGIYSWTVLYQLAIEYAQNWCRYNKRVREHTAASVK